MSIIRSLGPEDMPKAEAFLGHPDRADSSMFLRSGMREGGYRAVFGSFDGDALTGVAGLSVNGYTAVQAPATAALFAPYIAAASQEFQRSIAGINGPAAHVPPLRTALGAADWPVTLDVREGLYALDVAQMTVPEPLRQGTLQCRLARAEEAELLTDWYVDYDCEALHVPPSAAGREASRARMNRGMSAGGLWVLTRDDQPVAMSAFNARLDDTVQIGGVWTPPALRGRGYARAVVAGSLRAVEPQGVCRALLFTQVPAAIKAYTSIGFALVGDYYLLNFAMPTIPASAISPTLSASASEAVRPGLSMP